MQVERPSFKRAWRLRSGFLKLGASSLEGNAFEIKRANWARLMEGSGRRESNTWERTLRFGTTQGNLG
jgi:hypothetical protein